MTIFNEVEAVFFCLFAAISIVCSLMVILKKNAVTCAFNLILVFFAFAGIYALMGAHMVAALQVMVYAGAIMVLFVFVILLLNATAVSTDVSKTALVPRLTAGVIGALLFAGILIFVFRKMVPMETRGPFSTEVIKASGGNVQVISELLFSEYILPFELASVLLLAGIVAAVAIAMRKNKKRAV